MELGLGSLWLEAGVGSEADDQWSREPACQSGPDVAAYPVLLPPTLGEHVEQNVSLATSSDARLRRPVRVTVLRRADVCAMEPGPAPRKHAPPQAVYPRRLMGVWGFYRATWSIPGRIFGAERKHGSITGHSNSRGRDSLELRLQPFQVPPGCGIPAQRDHRVPEATRWSQVHVDYPPGNRRH